VISRPLLYFIAFVVFVTLGIAWWAGNYPARVTIINSSGVELTDVKVDTGNRHVEVALIANGTAKVTQLAPGAAVTIRTRTAVWTSPNALTPGGAVVVYVFPGGRIDARSRLGTFAK
jgi:hypothetical protein